MKQQSGVPEERCGEEFPMTVTGEVREVEMRERAKEMLGIG
ncbi:hypothetical protein [Actinopolyspora erythraea]|nr:hypothetical protein [Actinopolyspora erythraea]